MTAHERRLRKIMKTEGCDRAKAERFCELSNMLTAGTYTPEVGKKVHAELIKLRNN